MNDQSQVAATEEVVKDCIARIQGYWARRVEHEILDMVRLKLERSEPISEDERKAYNAALIATRRKTEPSAE
jgi:hypothetical protein